MLLALMAALLLGAVIYDLVSHRLPNYFLLLGLLAACAAQAWTAGWSGVVSGGAGVLVGFSLFLPFYVLGGMAAGDVKLMAVVGSFLGMIGAFWAGAYSLIAGMILGVLYLVAKGEFGQFLSRYWAMAGLRSYIPAESHDAARHRFPYAVAIAIGTMSSLYWTPI